MGEYGAISPAVTRTLDHDRPVVSVAEGCELLGVSKPTLLNAIRAGTIPHLRLGRRILISRAALLERLAAGDNNTPRPAA